MKPKLWTVALALGLFLGAAGSRADTPANDNCAGAEVIPASGPFPHLTSIVNIAGNTNTGDPTARSCGGTVGTNGLFEVQVFTYTQRKNKGATQISTLFWRSSWMSG